jgi:hypothetical protein
MDKDNKLKKFYKPLEIKKPLNCSGKAMWGVKKKHL